MANYIRHTLGSNSLRGHEYKGGCFHLRMKSGAWVQFAYGDPASNRRDSESQALAKAKAYLAANMAELQPV
jgi:hypothetical protein